MQLVLAHRNSSCTLSRRIAGPFSLKGQSSLLSSQAPGSIDPFIGRLVERMLGSRVVASTAYVVAMMPLYEYWTCVLSSCHERLHGPPRNPQHAL